MSRKRKPDERELRQRKRARVKRKSPALFALVMIIIGYFTFNILKQEYNIWQLSRKKAQLEENLKTEQLETNELKAELEQSETKSYIEYLAKKYLGLIYPDEKVYVPVEDKE